MSLFRSASFFSSLFSYLLLFCQGNDLCDENYCKQLPEQIVCGSNGRHYRNSCEVNRLRECLAKDIHVKSTDPRRCPGKTYCEYQRDRADKGSDLQGQHRPVCQTDGSFASVQCMTTDFGGLMCWCVHEDSGTPIRGSHVQGGRPDCSKIRTRIKSRKTRQSDSGQRRRCTPDQKRLFLTNLVRLFAEDYGNDLANAPNLFQREQLGRVIQSRFDSLDINGDSILQHTEMDTLRRLVIQMTKPENCAGRFPRMCDNDRSKSTIIASPNQRVLSTRDMLVTEVKPEVRQKRNRSRRKKDCNRARQDAIRKNRQDERVQNWVPQCTSSGTYERVQCHTDRINSPVCWCADEKTGDPLLGYSVIGVANKSMAAPDCELVAAKRWKGCVDSNKDRFLEIVAEVLLDRVSQDLSAFTSHEAAIQTIFTQLDIDQDLQLEMKEMRPLRQQLEERAEIRDSKPMKRCAKKLFRNCNHNKDRAVDLNELADCLKLPTESSKSQKDRRLTRDATRRNPLTEYLKPKADSGRSDSADSAELTTQSAKR